MLAEILANPVAWPLWAVLVFAASMYPLGFMLPGCVCCGSSGCTTCGIVATGYATGQNQYGRMCCDGTLASSITLRITSVGTSTGSSISRSIPEGGFYTKKTKTWSCSTLNGDYVLNANRYVDNGHSCSWLTGYIADVSAGLSVFPLIYGGQATPVIDLAFPNWQLFSRTQFRNGFTRSVRTQTCSGYPGPESCNIGSTSSESTDGYVGDTPLNYSGPDGGGLVTTGPVFSIQKCDPSGTVISTTAKIYTDLVPGSFTDSGCTVKVELV